MNIFLVDSFCTGRWYEWEQEKAGLERVKHWASSLRSRLNDSDVIIHGHTDEVR